MSRELFDRLRQQEDAFRESLFVAPVSHRHPITVRIAGVVQSLRPRSGLRHSCWGVWKPYRSAPTKEATYVREPTLTERQAYLDLFPSMRLVLCRKENEQWIGIPAGQGDARFKIAGMVPVVLPGEVQMFDTVLCRWDGSTAWFDRIDERGALAVPGILREQLSKLAEPETITVPGLTQAQRDAYTMALGPAMAADAESRRDKNEDRLRAALERAGGIYKSYVERADTLTVEYQVGRENFRSTVRKDNLAVESAGICLSGGDRLYDLQSLVCVVAEGQRQRHIVRVGDGAGLSEERYRDMYGDRDPRRPDVDNDDW